MSIFDFNKNPRLQKETKKICEECHGKGIIDLLSSDRYKYSPYTKRDCNFCRGTGYES